MVAGQCIVLPRLFQSNIAQPCQTSDQCDLAGTFCSKAGGWQSFGAGGCVYCGTYAPMDFQWNMDGETCEPAHDVGPWHLLLFHVVLPGS